MFQENRSHQLLAIVVRPTQDRMSRQLDVATAENNASTSTRRRGRLTALSDGTAVLIVHTSHLIRQVPRETKDNCELDFAESVLCRVRRLENR
jgi:hypothetical protein